MKRITKQEIERGAAAAIRLMRFPAGEWTENFLRTAIWPDNYHPSERRAARAMARAVLKAVRCA